MVAMAGNCGCYGGMWVAMLAGITVLWAAMFVCLNNSIVGTHVCLQKFQLPWLFVVLVCRCPHALGCDGSAHYVWDQGHSELPGQTTSLPDLDLCTCPHVHTSGR